jgi:spore coat polysaccharide biosynthesis protein SpsF
VVVRATGDDPLVAPAVVDACTEAVRAGADYAANTIDRTFPQGLVVEAMSMASFDRVEAASDEPHQREHVTQLYLEHPERFDRENVRWNDVYDWPLPCDRRDVRLALDEPDDYELLRAVYEGVEPDDRGIVPVSEAITYALAEDLTEWNRHVGQTKVQGDE